MYNINEKLLLGKSINNSTLTNQIEHFTIKMKSVVNDSIQIINMCAIDHCMLKYIQSGSYSQEAVGLVKELAVQHSKISSYRYSSYYFSGKSSQ